VTARVLHVSDLHVGKREAAVPYEALRELADTLAPDLLLATGDLANRGRRDQLERAGARLRALGLPVLAVPGNHDIPYSVPARFTKTLVEWERVFGTPEPVHESEGLLAVGLSSVRPWRQQGGALSAAALDRAAARLRTARPGSLRLVALHHHLATPPWRAAHKRPLHRRDHVLASLAEAGAELIAGGHVHQASVAELREFRVSERGRAGSLVLATAPGLGRPRPRRLGEAQGLNVYESDDDSLTTTTLAWDGEAFVEIARRSFSRRV
jgi:3',5'-cyclic AMP phosphodiesterase CpdA